MISNFFSLSTLQVVGFIIPFFTLPYLITHIGVSKFGIIALSQAILSYFIVFSDYGFNLTATREVSINQTNHSKLQEIFNLVITTKLFLSFVCIFLFFILFIFQSIRSEILLIIFTIPMLVGQILFPIWFFQGMEEMKYITYLTTISKILFTLLVFIFINEPEDYIYVNLLNGIGSFVSSLLSIWFIKKKFYLQLYFSSIKDVVFELKNGFHIMISSLSINVYTNSSIIILGLFVTPIILGYYSIAEKIMMAIRQVLSVFSQVIYPHICKLTKESHIEIVRFYIKFYVPFFVFIILSCISVFVFSEEITSFFTSQNVITISNLIKILCFAPIITCLNIPFDRTLLAYKLEKDFSIIITLGSIFSIILCFLFSYLFQATGTAIAILLTETFITLGLLIMLELKHKQISLIFRR